MGYGSSWNLERRPDALILHSKNSDWLFGLVFAGFSIFWLVGWNEQQDGLGQSAGFGNVIGLLFVAVGLFLVLPREVITIFDLRKQRVIHTHNVGFGLYRRTNEYDFTAIESLGLDEYSNEDMSYLPKIRLKDGKKRWLSVLNGYSKESFSNDIDLICVATGLTRSDSSSNSSA